MKNFSLVIVSLVVACNLWADAFLKEAVVKVDKASHLEILANPGLQTKKLNTLKIKLGGAFKDFQLLSFDATMPAHSHGMVVTPSKPIRLQDGAFEVKGVKLHMPGDWLLEIKVRIKGKEVTLKQRYKLRP